MPRRLIHAGGGSKSTSTLPSSQLASAPMPRATGRNIMSWVPTSTNWPGAEPVIRWFQGGPMQNQRIIVQNDKAKPVEERTDEEIRETSPESVTDPNKGSCKGPVQEVRRYTRAEFITPGTEIF